MRVIILLVMMVLAAVSVSAQAPPDKKRATEDDKIAVFDADGQIKRGAPFGDAELVPLSDVLASPEDFADRLVRISGYVVRSCKNQGCWAEIGAERGAKRTVRVTMKDHQFFIPLKSAGFKALAEGTFSVNKLSKERVQHLIEEDGATFENIAADGTVTELSFVANGIVLTKE